MTEEGKARVVSDANFDKEVLKSATPVLVDFWASWCKPCQKMAPILEAVAQDYAGRLTVAKLDVEDSPGTAQRYDVRGIPTLILFKGGQPGERVSEYMPKEELERWLDAAL